MGHLGPGRGRDQAGDAGVAEQVQEPDGPLGGADLLVDPTPVGRLLGEEAQVPEWSEAAEEAHLAPGQGELRLQRDGKAPAAAILLAVGIKGRLGGRPLVLRQARGPQALGLGPHHAEAAVALELAAAPGVEQLVIRPAGGAHDARRLGEGRGGGSGHPVRITRWRRRS